MASHGAPWWRLCCPDACTTLASSAWLVLFAAARLVSRRALSPNTGRRVHFEPTRASLTESLCLGLAVVLCTASRALLHRVAVRRSCCEPPVCVLSSLCVSRRVFPWSGRLCTYQTTTDSTEWTLFVFLHQTLCLPSTLLHFATFPTCHLYISSINLSLVSMSILTKNQITAWCCVVYLSIG